MLPGALKSAARGIDRAPHIGGVALRNGRPRLLGERIVGRKGLAAVRRHPLAVDVELVFAHVVSQSGTGSKGRCCGVSFDGPATHTVGPITAKNTFRIASLYARRTCWGTDGYFV